MTNNNEVLLVRLAVGFLLFDSDTCAVDYTNLFFWVLLLVGGDFILSNSDNDD
jgi:hypothetical protein